MFKTIPIEISTLRRWKTLLENMKSEDVIDEIQECLTETMGDGE